MGGKNYDSKFLSLKSFFTLFFPSFADFRYAKTTLLLGAMSVLLVLNFFPKIVTIDCCIIV